MKWIVVILMFATANLFAINDKNLALDKLKQKYGNTGSISIKMLLISDIAGEINAEITAEKGNKFRMLMNDDLLVSNGKTLWNFSKVQNRVIVSDFEEFENDISIEKLFFGGMKQMQATKLSKVKTSYSLTAYSLQTVSKGVLPDMELVFNDNFEILEINAFMGDEKQKWVIKSLNLNPKLYSKDFEFNAPQGTDVIDLR